MLVLQIKPAVRYDIMMALANWLDGDHHISFDSFSATRSTNSNNPLPFILPKPEFCSVACREELLRLQALRNALSDTLLKPSSHKSALEEGALDDLYEYHATLLEFEKRGFPTVDDPETGIQLSWKSAYNGSGGSSSSQPPEKHATLLWDRANTVYNIAALLSARAQAIANPSDRDACKQAVSYCQSAASMLSVLQQMVQSENFATVDLSNALLHFWQTYLLAQAQVFVYRMVAASNNHTTLSALSQSAHELMNQALQAAQDPRLISEVPQQAQEEWAPYCKANSMMAGAKAEYHQAVVHRLDHAWGKEIARLQKCHEKLQACLEFCQSAMKTGSNKKNKNGHNDESNNVVSYTLRECQAILPVVKDRWHEIDQDNYKIYQDDVPKEMPEIPAKQLAKTTDILPENMLVPKRSLFASL